MNILLLGATGQIGSRVRDEAVSRGHRVTAVARDISDLEPEERLQCEFADASDADAMNHLAGGHDAVVAALSPRGDGGAETYLDAIRTVLDVTERSDPERVLIVGGAGSLKTTSGDELVDTPVFPDAFKDEARVVREASDIAQASDANWTVLSPAAVIEPGERTGAYRTGGSYLLTDEVGDSRISFEDFAVALVDELEEPAHEREQFTVAY